MSIAASRPPATVVAPAPLPVPTPADREPASHPFAEMLRQNRGLERPAPEAAKPTSPDIAPTRAELGPEPTTASDEGVPTSDGSTAKSDAGRARARTGATTPRSAARAAGPTERPDRGPERSAERDAPDADRAPADASTVAVANPTLAMRPDAARPTDSELRFGPGAQRSPVAAGTGRDGDAGDAAASTVAIDSSANKDAVARGSDTPARADTDRSAGRVRDGAAATPATSFAQILADAKAADRPAAAAASAEAPPLPTTAVAAHEPQAPVAPDNALTPQSATLPVPVDSPEFAAAFGVQVSVFVREGVQHAELHLNPTETGPVSIAITLEGSQAHVEFGADLAATRQAIENGLPALASALRDAGFTLAGGGVAQHSRSGGNGQGGDEAAGRGRPDRRGVRGGEAIATQAVQRTTHRMAVGGIDLYA